jgi:hypothetical protein
MLKRMILGANDLPSRNDQSQAQDRWAPYREHDEVSLGRRGLALPHDDLPRVCVGLRQHAKPFSMQPPSTHPHAPEFTLAKQNRLKGAQVFNA